MPYIKSGNGVSSHPAPYEGLNSYNDLPNKGDIDGSSHCSPPTSRLHEQMRLIIEFKCLNLLKNPRTEDNNNLLFRLLVCCLRSLLRAEHRRKRDNFVKVYVPPEQVVTR